MTDLSFRQADPGREVSVKTGMAQSFVRTAHTIVEAINNRTPVRGE